MKKYCLPILILLISFHNGWTQNLTDIYTKLKNDKFEIIENKTQYNKYFDLMCRYFCEINSENNLQGDSLLTIINHGGYITDESFISFAIRTYSCFNNDQKKFIRVQSQIKLKPFSMYFHDFICKYKITDFNEYLKVFGDTSHIDRIQSKFIQDGSFSKVDILILNNLSTRAVLGDKVIEEKIINFVLKLFRNADEFYANNKYDKDNKLSHLYNKILPATLGRLESRSSVIESLELFDNDLFSDTGHDVKYYYYKTYYNLVIIPKIEINELYSKSIYFPKSGKDIKEIIYLLLNNNDIWLHDESISALPLNE